MPAFTLFLALLLSVVCGLFGAAAVVAQDMHSLKLVVDSPTRNAPPFAWFDKNQQANDGYVQSVLVKVFGQLGYRLDFVPLPLRTEQGQKALHEALDKKLVDGIAYISPSADLDDSLLLSQEPIMLAKLSVIRGKSDKRGGRMKDLLGQKGMSFFPRVDQAFFSQQAKRLGYKSGTIELDNSLSWSQAINKLNTKQADYILELSEVFNALSKTHLPKQTLVVSSNEPVLVLPIYVGLSKSKEHAKLLQQFDRQLGLLKSSGEQEFIFRSYMNKYIRYYISQPKQG